MPVSRDAIPAPLPCTPGSSRFHIKGLAYRGLVQLVERRVAGGLDALERELDDERVRAFVRQPFLAASRYDILPMLPLNATIARLLKKPLRDLGAQQGALQARHDVEQVYRSPFQSMNVDDPTPVLGRFGDLYYDFGECDAELLRPGHVLHHRRGLPEYVLPWFAPMHAAYIEELIRLKGVSFAEAVPRPPTAAGSQHGIRIVDLDTDVRWR